MAHLDGRQVPLSSTSVTSPGQVVVIKGEGMPLHDSVRLYVSSLCVAMKFVLGGYEILRQAVIHGFADGLWCNLSLCGAGHLDCYCCVRPLTSCVTIADRRHTKEIFM